MTTKIELNSEEYLRKLQEAADQIATERNVEKIKVIHSHRDKFGYMGSDEKLSTILEEAQARVNKKYKLKLEE
jgi:ABC-type Zn uptake system ZnuABC Zn-binding protein ZnuA